MKKYELVEESYMKGPFSTCVYQIRALKDFGNVVKGQLGGYIESEEQLSQEGDAWIEEGVIVCGTPFSDSTKFDMYS